MKGSLNIDQAACIRCGKCARVCPSRILTSREDRSVAIENPDTCIACGHCVAVCPAGAVLHGDFPAGKVHPVDPAALPTPEQMLLLLRARRSNRAFTGAPVPPEKLDMVLEAAHRAPTASNLQQIGFTLITDPEKLRLISGYTIDTFSGVLRKLQNPLLKPLLRAVMPNVFKLVPQFERLKRLHAQGDDLILRGARAVILIHAPAQSRFGCEDANLAYQNASLMAESLGLGHFYTGFVLAATKQDKKNGLARALGIIDGRIYAGMALGVAAFPYPNYIDRRPAAVNRF